MKLSKFFLTVLAFAFLFLLIPKKIAHANSTLYAKPNATGDADCSSWANACTLATALSSATSGDEIWVMEGVHTPGTLRTDTFRLVSNVALYGGFSGAETNRTERDPAPATNNTTLSGEIGTVALTDNIYHVVTGVNNATIDGFTITAGYADASIPNNRGGGMYNFSNSPTLNNIIFSNNTAEYGGGMYNAYSNPTVTNVIFSNNSTSYFGAGMYNYTSSPTITNVTFDNNSASNGTGGGMYNRASSSPTITNVTFSNNSASFAAGMYNASSSNPTITNATFSNNNASNYAGAIYNHSSAPTITNVTISDNSAGYQGGGMYNSFESHPTLTNIILWDNTASTGNEIENINDSAPVVSYSVIQGGYADGTNIITENPALGTLTDYGGPGMQILPIGGASSAFNTAKVASCPAEDQRGLARPESTGCDIGSFEMEPIANDTFSSPKNIDTLGNQEALNTFFASSALDDPTLTEACKIDGKGQATVWYTYIADSNTAISLDTFSAHYDTFIAVWTGTHPGLDLVACNDNASGTQQSQIAFQVENGTTYYIEVGQP